MKRISVKSKKLDLKRRLELVRTTVRELTPAQLGQANGGGEMEPDATFWACPTKCGIYTCEDG
jgi:hypothetical protein